MKLIKIFIFCLALSATPCIGNNLETNDTQNQLKNKIAFTENLGQVTDYEGNRREDVLFSANHNGMKIFLLPASICYQFEQMDEQKNEDYNVRVCKLEMKLENANINAKILKLEKQDYFENFYLSSCPNGITNVGVFEKITYQNIYPNIDWVIYSVNSEMKYDFIVHPGGNIKDIQIKYVGFESLTITENGSLNIKTKIGVLNEKSPVAYDHNSHDEIPCSFLLNNGLITFDIANYTNRTIVIDPILYWSTYYGTSLVDRFFNIATDSLDNVYCVGHTSSSTYIASDGFDNIYAGGYDAVMVKFNSSGGREWGTYYGGTGFDVFYGIATKGNLIYVCGSSGSTTDIAYLGYDNSYNGLTDGIIIKFDLDGNRNWATYLGGPADDYLYEIVVSPENEIYTLGETVSTTGIGITGFQMTPGGLEDAWLVKMNSSGDLSWSTYYGGSGSEQAQEVATDNLGNVFISGHTTSSSNIASGGFDNILSGSNDHYLVKFNSSGDREWGTYYGGSPYEDSGGSGTVAVSSDNKIYLTGLTSNSTGIAFLGYDMVKSPSYPDSYIVQFNEDGTRNWCTYYGGNELDAIYDIKVDDNNNLFVCGYTHSTDLAHYGFDTIRTGSFLDGFLTKFNNSGVPIWSTYIDGNDPGNTYLLSIAFDQNNKVYVGGYAEGSGLGFYGFDAFYSGGTDGLLRQYNASDVAINITPTLPSTLDPGQIINVDYTAFGKFLGGNVFVSELSNAAGDFLIPISTGSLATAYSGSIISTIPTLIDCGSQYRLRVRSTSPEAFSQNNGYDISINGYLIDSVYASIYSGETYLLPGGEIVNTSGTYIDTLGIGTGCDSIIVTILNVLTCTAPTDVSTTMITSNSAKIIWASVAGATKYQVWYRPIGGGSWMKKNTIGTSKKLTGLIAGTTYQYKIKSFCGMTSSSFTSTYSFTTPLRESYSIENEITAINISPNPSDGTFNVIAENCNTDFITIEAYDIIGRKLSQTKIKVENDVLNTQFSFPDYYAGNAIIKIIDGDQLYTLKVVIVK